MNKYFATFISGFSEFIYDLLESFDSEIEIPKLLDGVVVFKTYKNIEAVKNLHFLSNIYQLIDMSAGHNNIDSYISYISSNNRITKDSVFIPKKNKFFRIIVSSMGDLVSINNHLIGLVESKISKTFNLTVDRALPDSEFWIFNREDDTYLLGHRITYHSDYKKILKKGELRPDLCNLLCILSEPSKEDVFMDPFSGSESIVRTRMKMLGYKNIVSGDINFGGHKKLDVLNLKTIEPSSIDKIVTDPPWGINVGKKLDLESFYNRMMKEFSRVLVPGGILVLLIADKILFSRILDDFSDKFIISKYYDILVNGKQARIYKLIKR